MKILFKNTTKYTKENCNNFIEFHTNKYGKAELTKIIIAIVVVLYLIIVNIIHRNWVFIISALILGIILYFYYNKKSEKIRKSRNKVKEYTFYFYERYIKIRCKRRFERVTYFKIHKVFETDEYFFLYLDEKSSLILSKDGFEIGTPREFSRFIRKKCPFKYNEQKK